MARCFIYFKKGNRSLQSAPTNQFDRTDQAFAPRVIVYFFKLTEFRIRCSMFDVRRWTFDVHKFLFLIKPAVFLAGGCAEL